MGEERVVADEERDQGVEVAQAVVDRGGGEQDDLLRVLAAHQRRDRLGPLRPRVSQVVRLVDDDQRVVVELPARVLLVAPPGEPEFVVGHAPDAAGKAVPIEEGLPHALLERGRSKHEHPLPVLLGRLADHLGGDVGLAEPDFVGDQDAAVRFEQPQRAGHAVALEGRQAELLG